MTTVAFFDIALLAALPGRTIEPAVMDRHGAVRSICVQPREDKRKPLIEVVVHETCPDAVCDLGYGVAPQTVVGEDAPMHDYHVLWPGKPTTNTVEDYTWFEAFSEGGCATGVACTPVSHLQSKRKTEDGRWKER